MNCLTISIVASVVLLPGRLATSDDSPCGPYERQIAEHISRFQSDASAVRAAAAEALGFLRAYAAEEALIERLGDESVDVRRQAALALAWCGGREAVDPLLGALDDRDWFVRQAAHVSLTNLTGMEFAFHATAASEKRADQAAVWRDWWATVPADRPPKEVVELLVGAKNWPSGYTVAASSTYRGPPSAITDGRIGPEFWQTKNVPFPQWCIIDLGEPQQVAQVVIHQYGPTLVMTDYELATSVDNKEFDVVHRRQGNTPVELAIDFPPRSVRYMRITSYDSIRPTYPTTFFEVEINETARAVRTETAQAEWRHERALRALGCLGGEGATDAVLECLGSAPPTAPDYRPMVRAGIRALGRLQNEAGFQALVSLLDNLMWARNAAEALGDFGDRRAVPTLLAAYPRYAKQLDGKDPASVPADDKMGFPSEDRMLETPYWIAFALCRLPLDHPEHRRALREIAPLVIANLPGDHDTFMLYEREVGHRVTRHLLEQAGLRQQAVEHAFVCLGQKRRVPKSTEEFEWPLFPAYWMSSWLPALCTEPEDLPRLVALLEHDEGWVRINAAKALAWLGDTRVVEPIAGLLARAKAEADYGYCGMFKFDEYNDPAPRWREGLIRALGLLGADEHTDLIAKILDDQRSTLEVRHAAAEALADLGNDDALAALAEAAESHDFHSVRHIARDALQARGVSLDPNVVEHKASGGRESPDSPGEITAKRHSKELTVGDLCRSWKQTRVPRQIRGLTSPARRQIQGIVFIKGSNAIPNVLNTVQQADNWRQTYVVTDSGPAYRPGRNLYVLHPPRADGVVTPLTRFPDGYVAEPEVSWDGRQVVFAHRGEDDPWWHLYRVNVDGSQLVQLTDGPYHAVGPAFLPDGRIVFASSRSGIRDEYHGYPCTALYVMNADGSDAQPIATNIGRDNEPAVMPDGRIVFSRLEVFYSRNKTELTLHAMHPDGTLDAVLYGPERREYWNRQYRAGPRGPGEVGNVALTHRVLRITQPQPMPDGRNVIVATPGGLALVGTRRDSETIVTLDNEQRAYTTPFPLPGGRVLCASTLKKHEREKVDLGLYSLDPTTGKLELVYNDPATADFEPRPILTRPRPMPRPTRSMPGAYSGRFLCSSAFATQEVDVPIRGRLVRLIEGVPVVGRHSTHTNPWPVWKNHGGTFARVLGTAPLASDGSFYVEAPADRLLHFQVLDSDRRVIGNQLTWIYPRPGETKSCVGCHEHPHTTTRGNDPIAAHHRPLRFLPNGHEFKYRAKAWFKGHLPPEIEERTRTVRAVNLLAR